MKGAFRVEIALAIRANRIASEIFRDRQLMSANSAQNRACFVFVRIPNLRRMSSAFGVAFVTRKPIAAAFKFNGDHVHIALVMRTPRLRVNAVAVNFFAVN